MKEIVKYLLGLYAEKDDLELRLKLVNSNILSAQSDMIARMDEIGIDSLTDKASGEKFSIVTEINAKQTEYSKINDTEFMEIMRENGHDIFKYTCNYQTLGATIRNEIMQDGILPEWIKKYVDISEFRRIKKGR